MMLRLVREPSLHGATFGSLYLNGHWRCFTLEDEVREVVGVPVAAWKVLGQTAIPAGRYKVVITDSVRFKRPLPLLVDVPGFTGIRMHSGNETADTAGCILVGRDRSPGRLLQSHAAFEDLFPALRGAYGVEDIWVIIENAPPDTTMAA